MHFYPVAMIFFVGVGLTSTLAIEYDDTEIHGYHFHTYFFQNNLASTEEALQLRAAIEQQIQTGFLGSCRLNQVNMGPRGPHPIGSFETCCNNTALSPALSWFMHNHGNLSILLHPLTSLEVLDHTYRSMFLGPRYNLDISVLSKDLDDNVDHCLPFPGKQQSHNESPSNLMDADDSNANIEIVVLNGTKYFPVLNRSEDINYE